MEILVVMILAMLIAFCYDFSGRLYAHGETRDAIQLQVGSLCILLLSGFLFNFQIILLGTFIVYVLFFIYRYYRHTPLGYMPEDEKKLTLAIRKKYCHVFIFSILTWFIVYVCYQCFLSASLIMEN